MNEFLEAARNSEGDDSSRDRYEKLKKEQAGSDRSEAEKRYQKLQEEAKKEFVKKQEERKQEEENEDKDGDPFVTY